MLNPGNRRRYFYFNFFGLLLITGSLLLTHASLRNQLDSFFNFTNFDTSERLLMNHLFLFLAISSNCCLAYSVLAVKNLLALLPFYSLHILLLIIQQGWFFTPDIKIISVILEYGVYFSIFIYSILFFINYGNFGFTSNISLKKNEESPKRADNVPTLSSIDDLLCISAFTGGILIIIKLIFVFSFGTYNNKSKSLGTNN